MDLPGCWACLAGAWARHPLPSDPAMFVEPGLLSSNWVYFSIPGCKWSQLSVADLWEEATTRRPRRLSQSRMTAMGTLGWGHSKPGSVYYSTILGRCPSKRVWRDLDLGTTCFPNSSSPQLGRCYFQPFSKESVGWELGTKKKKWKVFLPCVRETFLIIIKP